MQRNYTMQLFAHPFECGKIEENSVLRYRRTTLPYFYPAGSTHSRHLSRYIHYRRKGINMEYLKAFIIGGIFCAIGQILIDRTKLTPARILGGYVVAGVILGAIGIYKPIAEFAGAGATVPLTGFGYSLAKGVQEAVNKDGLLGILTGGLKATAGGITAAIVAGLIVSFIFKPKDKS